MGRTDGPDLKPITSEPWLVEQKQRLQLERNGALRSARASAPQKCLTPPTLLETRCYDSYGDREIRWGILALMERLTTGRTVARTAGTVLAVAITQYMVAFYSWSLVP